MNKVAVTDKSQESMCVCVLMLDVSERERGGLKMVYNKLCISLKCMLRLV